MGYLTLKKLHFYTKKSTSKIFSKVLILCIVIYNRSSIAVLFSVTMLEKIDTSEGLAIVAVKEYQHNSTIKSFYVYKVILNPVKGEVLDIRMESKNPTNK